MSTLKSAADLELMAEGGAVLAQTLRELRAAVCPGISTQELNAIADAVVRKAGATSAFLGYRGFPASLCVSINDEVVHGIPSPDRVVCTGDLVSLDMGVYWRGFYTDAAITVAVGDASAEAKNLIAATAAALQAGIDQLHAGNHLGACSAAVQAVAKKNYLGIVRELVGHGIGRELHEEPSVPNYGRSSDGPRLRAGMVLAVEPMLTLGDHAVIFCDDGWTVKTADGSLSAHFEHTIAITEKGPRVLTSL